ncbi:TonB-dependent receptor plug domain-containing protein [Phenylobacterium montanum]|uniref:TonB-dependent receptor n=1 Tax=Phenylobacterium montanum TaxID=2823693 RepID=A0A975FZ00_9CAUL|nr:TonB-dependent receptor [Caulobacter sp. S6]QUD87458.1 TonB-dependent receptor [Caulobacter sp. S6]
MPKLRLRKSLLLAGAALVAAPGLALAQQTQPNDEIVVVANRAPDPQSKVGVSVTVLDAGAIQASQATVVTDLLQQVPGISVERNGGEGQVTSIFIRGADSDQTLVVVDGVPLTDPGTPSSGLDFSNLLTGDISRIEALRGAQSTLWGSQAMGGVVNIVTAEPGQGVSGEASAEGGSRGTQYYRAAVGGTEGPISLRLAGGYYATDGISAFDKAFGGHELDGFRNSAFSGRLGYAITPDVQLDLRGYATHSHVAFDGYDTPTFTFGDDAEFGISDQYVGYAGLNFGLFAGALKNRLAVQYTDIDRRLYDPGLGVNDETFYSYGAAERVEYQGVWSIAQGYRAIFGAQYERTSITTNTPAYDFGPTPPLKAHAELASGYAQIEGEVIPGLNLTAGVRQDQHSTFGGHTTGQASAAWSLNGGNTILRASFGQGFKAPSLYQLYSAYGSQTLHLASLRPETDNSWDLGVEQHFRNRRAMLSVTYFGRDTRDLIQFLGQLPGAPFGGYANVGHAGAEGVEVQAQAQLTPALSLTANYTYTDAEDLTDHTALLRRPRNRANLTASYDWPDKLTMALAVRYAGDSHDAFFDTNTFSTVPKVLKPYAVVDLRASYPLTSRFELYGRIENLFDRHYETAYQYGSLGRGGFVGVRATF